MNIEAMARAIFDAAHQAAGRRRDWGRHPDHDALEPGRDAFRAMAQAAADVAHLDEEPVADEPTPTPTPPADVAA